LKALVLDRRLRLRDMLACILAVVLLGSIGSTGSNAATAARSPFDSLRDAAANRMLQTMPTRTCSNEIAFLAAAIAQSEKHLNPIMVRYSLSVLTRYGVVTDHYVWLCSGNVMAADDYFGGGRNGMQRSIWDGAYARRIDYTRKGGRFVPTLLQFSDSRQIITSTHQYCGLSAMRIGPESLSAAIEHKGIAAVQSGKFWYVEITAEEPATDKCTILVVDPAHSYWPDRLIIIGNNGHVTRDISINSWTGGAGNPYIPKDVTWWEAGSKNVHLVVSQAAFGKAVPVDAFRVPDEAGLSVFDDRSRTWIRRPIPPYVPITQHAMYRTYCRVCMLMRHQMLDAIYDNGIRPSKGGCGLQCIWLLFKLEGRSLNWQDLYRKYHTADGTNSLAQLQDIARSEGISMDGYQVPASEISRLKPPFIVFTTNGSSPHYYLVAKTNETAAIIYWPPQEVMDARLSLIKKEAWDTGYVLAISQ